MRVRYTVVSPEEYSALFQQGGSKGDITTFNAPHFYQRGGGFLTVLGKLTRRAIPFIRRYILPTFGDIARDVSHDYAAGENFKQSLKKNSINNVRNLGSKLLQRGAGGSRSKSNKKKKKKKLRKIVPIEKGFVKESVRIYSLDMELGYK